MGKRPWVLGIGAGVFMLVVIIKPWSDADTPIRTTVPVIGDALRATAAGSGVPLWNADGFATSGQDATPAPAAAPQAASGTTAGLHAVYTSLFSADPRDRSGALDLIAQRLEAFYSQDQTGARLEDMTADSDPEVAEQAARVLTQLVGWRVIEEGQTLPITGVWEASRTTLPDAPSAVDDHAQGPDDTAQTDAAPPEVMTAADSGGT